MLSKLFYLAALVMFIVLAVGHNVDLNVAWPFACVAAGLLVEGYSPHL